MQAIIAVWQFLEVGINWSLEKHLQELRNGPHQGIGQKKGELACKDSKSLWSPGPL